MDSGFEQYDLIQGCMDVGGWEDTQRVNERKMCGRALKGYMDVGW